MSMTAYQGVWHDHTSDRTILTLNTRSAGFLLIILVIWVHFVASSTWPIVRFVLWSVRRRRDEAHDVFHAQRQVLIRNSSSAGSASWQLILLAWSWKNQKGPFVLRGLPYVLFTASVFAVWVVCGLFVPYSTTHASTDVLVVTYGPCGDLNLSLANYTLTGPLDAKRVSDAAAYAQQCYKDLTSTALCSMYPRPFLPFTPSYGGSCPTANTSLCITTNSTVLRLDTGPLNSNDHFGINAPRSDQVDYHRTLTCSPITLAPFASIMNTTTTNGSLYSPPNPTLLTVEAGLVHEFNYTFQYSNYMFNFLSQYDIFPYTYDGSGSTNQSWIPDANLFNSTDAIATLLLILGGSIQYLAPVYDPIFAAGLNYTQDHSTTPDYSGGAIDLYSADHDVTALFCTEQHQVCAPGSASLCTAPTSAAALFNSTADLAKPGESSSALSSTQIQTVLRLASSVFETSLFSVVSGRGGAALLASQTLSNAYQTAPIAQGQWQLEVANWFSTSLAMMQAGVFGFAAGIADPTYWPLVEDPSQFPALVKQCRTQRAPAPASGGYANFDFAAVVVIFGVGLALMLVGSSFDWFFGRVAGAGWAVRTHRDWIADGLLRVHRVALEAEHGVGEWDEGDHGENAVRPKSMQKIWPVMDVVNDDRKGNIAVGTGRDDVEYARVLG